MQNVQNGTWNDVTSHTISHVNGTLSLTAESTKIVKFPSRKSLQCSVDDTEIFDYGK